MLWHWEADVGHNYLLSIQLSNTYITRDMKMCLWLPTTSNYPVIGSNTLMQTTLLLFINKFAFFLAVGCFPGIHWSYTFSGRHQAHKNPSLEGCHTSRSHQFTFVKQVTVLNRNCLVFAKKQKTRISNGLLWNSFPRENERHILFSWWQMVKFVFKGTESVSEFLKSLSKELLQMSNSSLIKYMSFHLFNLYQLLLLLMQQAVQNSIILLV